MTKELMGSDPTDAKLRLRELLDERGWSLQQLSDCTAEHGERVSVSQLSNMDRNKRGFSKPTLVALAKAFGVPVVDLFDGSGKAPAAASLPAGELQRLEDLVSLLKSLRSSEGATTNPPDPNVVRAMLAMVDAVVEQVAKLRKV